MYANQASREMHVFDSSGSPAVDIEALADHGRELLGGTEVLCHEDFIGYCLGKCEPPDVEQVGNELAEMLAGARVTDPTARTRTGKQPQPVVDYERRMQEREPPRPVGVLYDAFELCLAYNGLLSRAGIDAGALVLVITDQLFGTFEEDDSRYHARVIIFGTPCIVSTTGLVEAPARPRSQYIGRQLGFDQSPTMDDASGRWLLPNDPRTTEVLKGYLAQAIFYYVTGEPFCEERGCRLFNAHWQEELLFSQLGSEREFCEYHRLAAHTLKGVGNA